METLQRGDDSLHAWALELLLAMLQSPGIDTGPLAALTDDSALFQPLSSLLQGPLHQPALQAGLLCCLSSRVHSEGEGITAPARVEQML